MFYDRLLNHKSLKTRLLSSSSFAPLYSSDQKLPLAKFRREGMNLTPLIAGLLAACGGSTTYVPVGEVVITTSGDGSSDGGTTPGGTGPFAATDATGSVAVGAQYAGHEITVDLAGSFDLFTATEFTGGVYKTTSDTRGGDIVISPLTYLVEELMAADPTLDQQAALEILFGTTTGVVYNDIINPDNYAPASAPNTSHGAGHPISILEAVSQTSINLQVLMEQHDFSIADIVAALLDDDGFAASGDLTSASLQAATTPLQLTRQPAH